MWQYRVEILSDDDEYLIAPGWFKEIGHPDNLAPKYGKLDDLGSEGWELVAVQFDVNAGAFRGWFKRRIEARTQEQKCTLFIEQPKPYDWEEQLDGWARLATA